MKFHLRGLPKSMTYDSAYKGLEGGGAQEGADFLMFHDFHELFMLFFMLFMLFLLFLFLFSCSVFFLFFLAASGIVSFPCV